MIINKKINIICTVITVFAVLLTIIFMNGESLGITVVSDGDKEGTSDSEYFTANDVNSSWDTDSASKITLNGSGGSVSGGGAYFLDGDLYIVQSGYYVISGELNGGSIIVEGSKKSRVWIMLNGVKVSSEGDAAFRINKAKKVFITLADGTVNTFTDNGTMTDEAAADGTNACIYTHSNLAINGSGKLTINGNYKNGITAKDNLVIAGGVLNINAAGDGIRTNEKLKIRDAEIDIAAEDDGLVVKYGSSDSSTDSDNKNDGYLYIMSGTINVVSKDDAVNSAGEVTIDGGTINIAAADDGIHSETNVYINGGAININECYEGIEALTVTMTAGDVRIYPSDDGINANGGSSDAFGGGQPGGQGSQSDGFAGQMGSTEDAEGGFNGQQGNAKSQADTADGRNVAADGSGRPELPDGNGSAGTDGAENNSASSSSAEDSVITISGGTLTIINTKGNDCDGLDSNGSIYISGGDIRISLPGSGTNSAIDYGSESSGVCVITGGTVIACGGSEMIESFDEASSQCSILYNLESSAKAGSTLSLADSSGNVLLEYEIPNSFTSVNISCPEMKVGETYSLSIGNTVEEISQDSVVTVHGDTSGVTIGQGFGGMQQGGPGQQNGNDGGFDRQNGSGSGEQNGNGMSGFGPGENMNGSAYGSDQTAASVQDTDSDNAEVTDTAASWAMIGASGAVMLLGLVFGFIYKRKEF
ncbi:MAG: carbohydrate-binding domain-containing protein [Lachnospiraceae bacterium]|nr:carbohydrate-binding domain-containing protein [Lachnospiraceae bacterium]